MIRRLLVGGAALVLPFASFGYLVQRAVGRLIAAPRYGDGEDSLRPAIDALGGEVVRLRSRDGLRLAGRWLPAEPDSTGGAPMGEWLPESHEAVLLLHGYSGSVAPDLLEFGPFLRRTANVLGLDFRGHGGSDPGPTTFGMLEVEDVAGALAWLGERGIRRVALMGTSMGAVTALSAVAILGDASLAGADGDPNAPVSPIPAPRPQIVGVVAESATPEVALAVASRIGGPFARRIADLLFAGVARRLGSDPRATEPGVMVGLVPPVPMLFIHGDADDVVPLDSARRLAGGAGDCGTLWVVPGAHHSRAHQAAPAEYEARVTTFLRAAFGAARTASAETGTGETASAGSPMRRST